jgi:hypothetical protein
MEILTNLIEVLLYYIPTRLEEFPIELIRARRLIRRHVLYIFVNFFMTKRFNQVIKVVHRVNKVSKAKEHYWSLIGIFYSKKMLAINRSKVTAKSRTSSPS